MGDECVDNIKKGGAGLCCLSIFIVIITTLSSCKTLKHDEQMVVHYLDGKRVYNGPMKKVFNPFRTKEKRKALRLLSNDYVLLKDMLSGVRRIEVGPKRFFMTAYEEAEPFKKKFVVPMGSFIRFVNRLNGTERVVGTQGTEVPGPWEEADGGVQIAPRLDPNSGIIVLNKATGEKVLKLAPPVTYYPQQYEVVVERVIRERVELHTTRVLKNAFGKYTVHRSPDADGRIVTFFKQPYEEFVEFEWSSYTNPGVGGTQTIGTDKITEIDMKEQTTYYQYDVRTNDNVAMRVEGFIRWKIVNVTALLEMTADPVGDVWYKCRSTVMAVTSLSDLLTFSMGPPAALIAAAMDDPAYQDDFWTVRGLDFSRVTVTKAEALDQVTKNVLQEINKENDNKRNAIEAQRTANERKSNQLKQDVKFENNNKVLIEREGANDKLLASSEGEALGVQHAQAAKSFLEGLNETMPNMDTRLDLYNLNKQLENQNKRTKFVADGDGTTLFLTSEEINLNLKKEL